MSETFNEKGEFVCSCGVTAARLIAGPQSKNAGRTFYKCDNKSCRREWLYWGEQVEELRAQWAARTAAPSSQPGSSPTLTEVSPSTPAAPTSQPCAGSSQPTGRTPHRNITERRTDIQSHSSFAPGIPTTDTSTATMTPDVDRGHEEPEFDIHPTDDEYEHIDVVRGSSSHTDPLLSRSGRTVTPDGSPRRRQRMPGAYTASMSHGSTQSVTADSAAQPRTSFGRIHAWRDTTMFDGSSPTQDTSPEGSAHPRAPFPPSTPPSATTASTATRIHGLATPSSQGSPVSTVRLSEPSSSPQQPPTPMRSPMSFNPEERLRVFEEEIPIIRRRFIAERTGHEYKARALERVTREKNALHDRCEQLEAVLAAQTAELNELRRRIAVLEGSAP